MGNRIATVGRAVLTAGQTARGQTATTQHLDHDYRFKRTTRTPPKLAARKNLVVGISDIDKSGKSRLDCRSDYLDDFLHPKEIRHENKNQSKGCFNVNFNFACLVERGLTQLKERWNSDPIFP